MTTQDHNIVHEHKTRSLADWSALVVLAGVGVVGVILALVGVEEVSLSASLAAAVAGIAPLVADCRHPGPRAD